MKEGGWWRKIGLGAAMTAAAVGGASVVRTAQIQPIDTPERIRSANEQFEAQQAAIEQASTIETLADIYDRAGTEEISTSSPESRRLLGEIRNKAIVRAVDFLHKKIETASYDDLVSIKSSLDVHAVAGQAGESLSAKSFGWMNIPPYKEGIQKAIDARLGELQTVRT